MKRRKKIIYGGLFEHDNGGFHPVVSNEANRLRLQRTNRITSRYQCATIHLTENAKELTSVMCKVFFQVQLPKQYVLKSGQIQERNLSKSGGMRSNTTLYSIIQ